MGPREALVDLLGKHLDAARYQVAGSLATPDRIETGKVAVRTWASDVAPAVTVKGLRWTLTLWVLTPHLDDDRADTDLDRSLVDVLGVLYSATSAYQFDRAERAVLDDAWHGWRLTLTAGTTITTED